MDRIYTVRSLKWNWQRCMVRCMVKASRNKLEASKTSGYHWSHTEYTQKKKKLYLFKVYKTIFTHKCMQAKLLQSCPFFATLWQPKPTRLLCSRDSPGKNPGVDGHALLQRSSQPRDWTLNLLCLLHWQRGSLQPAPGGTRGKILSVLLIITHCYWWSQSSYQEIHHLT